MTTEASAREASGPGHWTRHLRWLMFVVGVGALVLVVREVGVDSVAAILHSAGAWLPLLMLLEAAWMGMDVFVLRTLLGERARDAPPAAYARSAMVAYAIMVLAPAGRASGEVARAVILAPWLGTGRVTAAAARIQGSSLLGNALISVVCFAVVAAQIGVTARLTLLVGLNGLLTAAAGAAFVLGARSPALWRWLRRFVKSLPAIEDAAPSSSQTRRAVLLSFLGRAGESVLYLALLRAAAGIVSPGRALVAQSISLVTAFVGDVVPQRAGLTESAFWYFAPDLRLPSPATAVAVALLCRANQMLLAATCLFVGFVWKGVTCRSRRAD